MLGSAVMLHERLVHIQKILLLTTIICLPFMAVPHLPFGASLVTYPLFLGIVLGLIDSYRERQWYIIPKKYCSFIMLFFCWNVLCIIIGVLAYPFYDTVNMGQSDKLTVLLQALAARGVTIDDTLALQGWLIIRFIKDSFFTILFSFGGSLWIYSLYHRDWQQGFKDVRKGIFILTACLCVYSLVEIASLMGNGTATNILTTINPLYMDIKGAHGWWPPLLWDKQLRSLFPEPSFFGIISTVILPFLWSYLIELKKISAYYILYILYVVMIFMTRARTATGLFLGEIGLVIIYVLTLGKAYRKQVAAILILSGMAFFLSVFIVPGNNETSVVEKSTAYIEDSVTSVAGNQRSNIARKSNVLATTKVGIENPVFGVGYGLKDAYIVQNLPSEALENQEVKLWLQTMEEKGILKSGFPTLNKLSTIFADSGAIGSILYILPFLYVIVLGIRKKVWQQGHEVICLYIALAGSMVAFFSNDAFWSIYVVLGLLLCVVDGDRHEE